MVDIIVADGFVLTELSAILEVLRIANRVCARDVFKWHCLSRLGGTMQSRAGLSVDTDPLREKPSADYLFVIGNSDPDAPELGLYRQIKAYQGAGARVFLLSEAASRFIADSGEQHMGHTTHWENRVILNERGTPGQGSYALAAEDGLITTSAGMGASFDLVLALLEKHISAASVSTVADIMLHETIRNPSTLQPFGGKEISRTGNRALDQCVELMQANLEDPLRIAEIARLLDVSERSLERHFRNKFDTTPNTYYREIRLNQANTLLLKTNMSVREIGLACGFPNGFSSLFRRHFGASPMAIRQKNILR